MRCKSLHKWNVTPKEAVRIQNVLRKKITLSNSVGKINFVAAADVSYIEGRSLACVCVLTYPGLHCVEYRLATSKTSFPYIPGLLTFREAPSLIRCLRKIRTNADVIFFDGQGVAHPRNMGIASHMGILLDKPTIGCAKSLLYGQCAQGLKTKKGNFVFLKEGSKKIGVVLRTRDNTKPIYVSPGYGIDFLTARDIVLKCLSRYRIPEPLRLAHHLSKTGSARTSFKARY